MPAAAVPDVVLSILITSLTVSVVASSITFALKGNPSDALPIVSPTPVVSSQPKLKKPKPS